MRLDGLHWLRGRTAGWRREQDLQTSSAPGHRVKDARAQRNRPQRNIELFAMMDALFEKCGILRGGHVDLKCAGNGVERLALAVINDGQQGRSALQSAVRRLGERKC